MTRLRAVGAQDRAARAISCGRDEQTPGEQVPGAHSREKGADMASMWEGLDAALEKLNNLHVKHVTVDPPADADDD